MKTKKNGLVTSQCLSMEYCQLLLYSEMGTSRGRSKWLRRLFLLVTFEVYLPSPWSLESVRWLSFSGRRVLRQTHHHRGRCYRLKSRWMVCGQTVGDETFRAVEKGTFQ